MIYVEHCLPTVNYGEVCDTLSSPYLGNCKYDGAGAALNTLYHNSKLNLKANAQNSSR